MRYVEENCKNLILIVNIPWQSLIICYNSINRWGKHNKSKGLLNMKRIYLVKRNGQENWDSLTNYEIRGNLKKNVTAVKCVDIQSDQTEEYLIKEFKNNFENVESIFYK